MKKVVLYGLIILIFLSAVKGGKCLFAGFGSNLDSKKRLDVTSSENESLFQKGKASSADHQIIYSQLLIFAKLGRYDTVIAGCKKIIAEDYSFLRAYELLIHISSEISAQSSPPGELEQTTHFFQSLLAKEPDNAYLHYGLGLAYKFGKDYPKSKHHLEKSIMLGADFWEVFEELIPYYRYKEELEKAIVFLGEGIRKNPENFFLYQGLGYAYFWLDDYGPSLEYYKQALRMQRTNGNRGAEAKGLYYLAYLYMYLNDYTQASKNIERSIDLAREALDKHQEVQSMELLSFIHTESGVYAKALELCRSALSIAQNLSNKKLKMICLRTLGVIHMEMGDFSKAQDYLEKSTDFYRNIGEIQRLGISLYWMAVLHQGKADFSKALEYALQGLGIAQQLGFKTGEAFHLSTIGDIYFSLGNYDKALKFNEQALAITEKYVGKWSREECYNTIGYVYLEMNQYERALEYFKQALDYVRRIDHRREEAKCLHNIGYAFFKANNFQKALGNFLESLNRANLSGKKTIKGMNFCRLGELYFQTGDYIKSEQFYSKALAVGQEIGQPSILWMSFSGLGTIFKHKGMLERAVAYYKEAVKVIEALRSQIMITEFSSGFFKSKIRIYEHLVDVLYDLHNLYPSRGYDLECFYFAEKAKARAFLDDLQEARVDLRPSSLSTEEQNESEILSRKISHVLTALSSSDLNGRTKEELWNELENTEDRLQRLTEFEKRENPDYASITYHEPLRLPEVQDALLDEETGMIEYLVGEKNIFIFFCTKAHLSVHRMSSEASRATLKLVKNYVKLLSSKHFSFGDCEIAGRRIYERLILPAKKGFGKELKRLIIIPDIDLYYLPFEALIVESSGKGEKKKAQYLMEDYMISYAPSASSLRNIINREKNHIDQMDLLAVGDPVYAKTSIFFHESIKSDDIVQEYYLEKRFNIYPLMYASKELKSISNLLKKGSVHLISQEKATEENVKKLSLADYKIIHFATHSLLDEKNAMRSALVLELDDNPKEDGFLQAREIYSAELDADLVVLSACQTAKGKIEQGEGIQGLARAFFYAGTKSVLASLWKVDDKSTAEFMKYFYDHLARGKTKQEALSLAKIKMIQSKYSRPYYWAAFILIGDSNSKIRLNRASFWRRLRLFS